MSEQAPVKASESKLIEDVTGETMPDASTSTRASIMIIDDDLQNIDLMSRWLGRGGYVVRWAADAEDGLRMIHDQPPDLLVLDVMMPRMDGYELCEQIRSDSRFSQIPIIFVSAHSDPREKVKGLRLGAADYLSRPYHGEELLARIDSALRSKVQRDELLERTRSLEEQSMRDALTGIYNRRYWNERIGEEVARAARYGQTLSCLMIDVDNFKRINDSMGHGVGDERLCKVAGAITQCARATDIVARYGGEEFSAILPQTPPREAYELAERIRLRVNEIKTDPGDLQVMSVSIGLAAFPGTGVHDSYSLVGMADRALLRAKVSGKNRTVMANPEGFFGPGYLPGKASPPRILIVEDEPNNQILLQKILTRMGYGWDCVTDGSEAVARVASQMFSLVLMDLSLPGMDGWTATSSIRASGNQIPIIATSAHAMSADKQRAMDAGCTEYLTKPFNLTELRRILGQYAPLPAATPV